MSAETEVTKDRSADELRALILVRVRDGFNFSGETFGLSGQQIAKWLDIAHSTAKYHLDALVSAGLVERVDAAHEFRPTAAGKAAAALESRRK